jgi:hypothetical protein
MHKFIAIVLMVFICLYLVIAFISFLPNPSDWGNGGRGAFTIAVLVISCVAAAIEESINNK